MIDYDSLTDIGIKLLGSPVEPTVTRIRCNFYGTSIRIQSSVYGIDAHVKANPENFANEAKILTHFHNVGLSKRFPKLIASSSHGDIVATQSCGEPMRELFKVKTNSHESLQPVIGYLTDALSALVEAQSTSRLAPLIDANAAFYPTDRLAELMEQMAADGLEDSVMSQEDAHSLKAMVKQWLPLLEELASLGLGDFWDHGDFGSGNVLLSTDYPKRAVIIDLSESAIMCPCFSASQFIHRLHGHLGIDPDGDSGHILRNFWANKSAEHLGKPKSALERGFDICSRLYIPYGLLISQRFAKAHRLHTGSKFENPTIKSMTSALNKPLA